MGLLSRQTSGSVVCTSCGSLVGVNDETCYNCGRRNPGLWGYAPVIRRLGADLGFVKLILIVSVGLYVVSLLLSGSNIGMGGFFSLFSPNPLVLFFFGASGGIPVFGYGRWWTVLSAGWLHASLLHVAFNMMWVRQLAPATAELFGPGRLVIIYTIGGIAGFALSTAAWAVPLVPFLRGAGFTVGASAPVFGLLGALVCYGRRSGSQVVHSQALSWALLLGIFGLIMPGIDNYAHAGGFIGGYAAARVLDPLKPERLDHVVIALVCLVATAVAVVASMVHGVQFLP